MVLLNINVDSVLRVPLDPFLTGLHLFAHEDGEDGVGPAGILQSDPAERTGFRVHGGLPQFVGVHFAQTLEAADVDLGVGIVGTHLGGNQVTLLVGVGHLGSLAAGQLVQGRNGGLLEWKEIRILRSVHKTFGKI